MGDDKMSELEATRVMVNLTAKGTDKIEAQVDDDLDRDDPDPVVGEGIVKRALEDQSDGESNSAG